MFRIRWLGFVSNCIAMLYVWDKGKREKIHDFVVKWWTKGEKQIFKKMSRYFPGEGAQSFPQPCVEGRDCCTPVVSKFWNWKGFYLNWKLIFFSFCLLADVKDGWRTVEGQIWKIKLQINSTSTTDCALNILRLLWYAEVWVKPSICLLHLAKWN